MDPVHPFLRERARLLHVERFDPPHRGYDAPLLLKDLPRRAPRVRLAMLLCAAAIVSGAVALQGFGAEADGAGRHAPVVGSARNAAIGFIALTRDQGGCPEGLMRAYITTGGAAPALPSCWHRSGGQVLLVDAHGVARSYPAERFGLVEVSR